MATKNDNKGVSNIIIPGENKDANLEMTPRTMNKSPVRTQHKDVALGEKKSPPRKTSFQNKNKTGQRCNSVMDVTSPPKQHESQLRVMESQQHIKIGGNQVQMQGSQEIEGGPPVESILDNPTELYALGKEIDK